MLRQPRALVPFGFERRRNWKYLLDVEFAASASAPLSSYEGEVGRIEGVDTPSVWGVSSGKLSASGASSTSGEPRLRSSVPYTIMGGRGMVAHVNLPSALTGANYLNPIGWNNTSGAPGTSTTHGVRTANSGLWSVLDNAVIVSGEPFALDTDTIVTVVFRGTFGHFLFVNKNLVWVGTRAFSSVSAYAHVGTVFTGGSGKVFTVDYLRVKDFGAPFDSDYGIALLHTASVSGSDYTATANLITDLVVNAPASLAGTAGLRFRKAGNDYWQAHFNSSGDLIVQRYAGGVAQGSSVTLASGAISGSASLTLRVIATGSAMDFYTLSGTTWTKRGSQQTDGVLNANTGVMPFADGSWSSGGGSVGQLDAYARSDASYDGLDGA